MSINDEVSKQFNELAELAKKQGLNKFKIAAYKKAALIIGSHSIPIDRDPDLGKLKGIGKSTLEKINVFLETGIIGELEETRKKEPVDLEKIPYEEILRVEGIGPVMAKNLFLYKKVCTIKDLEKFLKSGDEFKGITDTKREQIVASIKYLKISRGRIPYGDAYELVERILEKLDPEKQLDLTICGSFRRGLDTCKDIDILICEDNKSILKKIIENFNGLTKYFEKSNHLLSGNTKSSIVLEGTQIDLRIVETKYKGPCQLYFTGSSFTNILMRVEFKKLGLKLSEYGVFNRKTDKRLELNTEEEIFNYLGYQWVPPEHREENCNWNQYLLKEPKIELQVKTREPKITENEVELIF